MQYQYMSFGVVSLRKRAAQWRNCCWWREGPITSEIHIRQHILWSFGVAARNFFSFVPKKAVLEEDMLDSSWGMAPPASSIRVDQLMRKQSTIVPRLLLSVVMLLNIS